MLCTHLCSPGRVREFYALGRAPNKPQGWIFRGMKKVASDGRDRHDTMSSMVRRDEFAHSESLAVDEFEGSVGGCCTFRAECRVGR